MIRRPAALPTAFAVLFAAGAASAAGAAPVDPAPLLLRLPDLGPGYVISRPDRACVPLHPSKLARGIFGPGMQRGCSLLFYRAWTAPHTSPDPTGITTSAYAYDTPTGPATVLAHPRRLATVFLGRTAPRVVEPAPQIGDQAVLLRVHRKIRDIPFSAGLVIWRSGVVLGVVEAASISRSAANAPVAVHLATLQQARIANPTPLRPPVNDDRFVPLDDPTLGVPVMWLGEALPRHGRLPLLHLWATGGSSFFPGYPLVRMFYRTPHRPYSATVGLWQPRALHRKLRAPLRGHRCRRRLDGGLPHTTIVAAYARRHGRCPHNSASFSAVAFFRGVGVTIDVSGRLNPYDSHAGMRTLLRALRPREPRLLPAPAP